jgi:hypothetical protein
VSKGTSGGVEFGGEPKVISLPQAQPVYGFDSGIGVLVITEVDDNALYGV